MRFDDRIATVLALPESHRSMLPAKWRQLVDLLAQQRERVPSAELAEAYAYLRRYRDEIDATSRRAIGST